MEAELTALLAELGLEELQPVLEEEAINELALLQSMGAEMLQENLSEIGVSEDSISRLSAALFPDDDEGLEIEENDEPVPSGGEPSGGDGAVATVAYKEAAVVVENMTEQEAEMLPHADWLLKPFMIHDLAELKKALDKATKQAHDHFRNKQFANAQAAYTRALLLEAPNKRANAALYYNRAACHKQLGNLHLALRDATLAAEADPPNSVRAWWRAADAAMSLGDAEAADEAIKAGLSVQPGCVALKRLAAQLKAAASGI